MKQKVAKFDLSTFIDVENPKFSGNFNYATCLYKQDAIKQFIETYVNILKQLAKLVNSPAQQERMTINNLSYLNEGAYGLIVLR